MTAAVETPSRLPGPACPDNETLGHFLAGRLTDAEAEPIERHLDGCPSCLARLGGLSAHDRLLDAVRGWGSEPGAADEPATVASLILRLCQPAAAEAAGPSTPTLSAARRVAALADRFERAWKATTSPDQRPRLADYLQEAPEPERAALLSKLIVLDIAYRRRAGEHPKAEDYWELVSSLDQLQLVRTLDVPPAAAGPKTDDPPAQSALAPHAIHIRCPHCHNPIQLVDDRPDEVLCPSCGSSFRLRDARHTTTQARMRPLGKFQLLERVGTGAFGAVWRARDTQLDRIVALKIPHADSLTDEADLERFAREARAAAQLRHPGIVTVHEVQTLEGRPAIVSDFIDGLPLKDLMELRRLTFREAAALIADVAEALDYAHGRGLVHRDIKPANIMIEYPRSPTVAGGSAAREAAAPGEVGKPLVMDFGLARRDQAEVTLTLEGHILGTPAYMSPEQAAGQGHQADRRSDVYSLGVILYELLTGELPFRGTKLILLHQVLHDEPRPPRRLNDKIPRELETICLKAMAKEPRGRYGTARELADELRRFLNGEPIAARPVGQMERTWRWCRRNPAVASLLVAVFLVTGAGFVGVFWQWQVAEAHAQEATDHATRAKDNEKAATLQRDQARDLAEELRTALARLRRRTYAAEMNLAKQAWDSGGVDRALELLAQHRPGPAETDLRGFEWHYLHRLGRSRLLLLNEQAAPVHAVAFSPDGNWIASALSDLTVLIWDAHTGRITLTLKGHSATIHDIAFSPDGQRLASASGDKTIMVWDARTGQALPPLKGHTAEVEAVAFSPDGQLLASASYDKTVRVWEVQTGRQVLIPLDHAAAVRAVAFSPDGKQLASASNDQTVVIWDAQSRQKRGLFKHDKEVLSLAWSPDGKHLATAPFDGTVHLWDAQTGGRIHILTGHMHIVRSVVFSPNGEQVVSASYDQTVRVWETRTGKELLTLKGHTGSVMDVSFSPDGNRLVSGSLDGAVRVWHARSLPDFLTLKGYTGHVGGVAFSPDGNYFAGCSATEETVKVWDIRTNRVYPLEGPRNRYYSVAFRPDGRGLAAAIKDQRLRVTVWHAQTGKMLSHFEKEDEGGFDGPWFSSDGQRVACWSRWGQQVKVWDAPTGRELLTLKTNAVIALAFHPDGQRLATGSRDGLVELWDLQTGQTVRTLKGHTNAINFLVFSPDGQRLASASEDHLVKVWEVQSGQELLTLKGHTHRVRAVTFSPDGQRLASGSDDRTVKLWDTQTGLELLSLTGHTDVIFRVAFSPDGRRLVSTSRDYTVRLWDATPLPAP